MTHELSKTANAFNVERYNKFSIELDCPPGMTRPDDLIGGVIKDTGIEVEDFEPTTPFFGHKTFLLKASANKDEIFTSNKLKFKERISQLYYDGRIRYGTW